MLMNLYTFAKTVKKRLPHRVSYGIVSLLADFDALLRQAQTQSTVTSYYERYDIHRSFSFGHSTELYGGGGFDFDQGSYIGNYGRLKSAPGETISIGENTAISHYVFMYTINRRADQDLSKGKEELSGPIHIGDDCWIGAFVFITEDVTIGDGAVVGANSVVIKSLPPHSICAGTPARVVSFKSHLSEERRAELQDEFEDVIK
jgi:acetyltransferase-like isoleucine patch superfamily enzyme